jgi:predicted transcriptional regulator
MFDIPLLQLVANKPLVTIDGDKSVKEGVQLLSFHKITSAPVYSQGELYIFYSLYRIGIVDYNDLVTCVLQYFRKIPKSEFQADISLVFPI